MPLTCPRISSISSESLWPCQYQRHSACNQERQRSPQLMRVLLARIGFMKFYKGPKPGDEKPIGGGKYNTEGIGHEAYNFLNVRGSLYGYFQPHMKSPYEINL